MTNRLAGETSPYLKQHAENPVDWYPWGTEALARARREDRPILLSIGYAACHWCHVMAHESFEDEATARLMNELFVNIKVDREERPDLDGIYMTAVQAMTGHGGWPMTMFLTPEGVPFYAGTYFPPADRQGMPAFARVLQSVATAYRERRADVDRTAEHLRELYARTAAAVGGAPPAEPVAAGGADALTPALLERAAQSIAARYDRRHGGFAGAPKFPQTMALDFMLRWWRHTGDAGALEMVRDSFTRMSRGGIYDHVAGGFHRYAVDAEWLVPHFEKMLYDNALLARLGAHLYQATGDADARRVAEETVDWVAAEMTSPGGGFYSSLDADSEGEEGKFYVWDAHELDALLGADAPLLRRYWGVTDHGNFEGRNILHVTESVSDAADGLGVEPAELENAIARARRTLGASRAHRVRPGRDDKVLASWNGLMLAAVAECARVFGRSDYRALAVANGAFLFRELVHGDRVMRTHTAGVTKLNGYLEDAAAVALGALSLYELTFDAAWLARSRSLAAGMVARFWSEEDGTFFDTSNDHEALITRPREITDNATPSGTSLAVELLLRLGGLTGESALTERATRVLASLAEPMTRHGPAFGRMLGSAAWAVYGAVEVALVGEPAAHDFHALVRELAGHYVPELVLAGGAAVDGREVALLAERGARDGRATAYVCRRYVCRSPVTTAAALGEEVERAVGGAG